ncbi:MAG: VOC family protein [Actinobacteria bacterium]|nr:VOC family protein [Betaproteobacteria bacterium]MBV8478689.1 VOC family protein [Actinomycetota bacterium]
MGNPVVHWEMNSEDPQKLSDFYAKLFGWKVTYHPQWNYRAVDTGSKMGIGGGMLRPDRSGPWPSQTIFYIAVDELAPYRKKIEAAGGKIHVEEQEVPGMGWLSLFTDPEGRMLGLWKPAQAMPARKPAKKAKARKAKKATKRK